MTALAIVAFALAALLTAMVAAWLGSSALLVPRPYELMPEFTIQDYRDGEVTLPAPPSARQFADTRKVGTFGLVWQGGYGVLGGIERDDGGVVVRRLEIASGAPPSDGAPARIDTFVFRTDPSYDRGLTFEDVSVAGEVGPLSGWWLPGDRARGVLVLHGRRRGERAEALRILPVLADGRRNVLVLAYRNHRGAPASPDGLYHYGASEAEDALAGVRYLAERGAQSVVVVGFSMGGATALEAVKRWPQDGPRLAGVILDSPLVDPAAAVVQRMRRAGVPFSGAWARVVLAVAAWRSGVRWRDLDQRRSAARIAAPVLLIAGVRDGTVPVSTVDAFAERLTSEVRYERVADADHIEAWNIDPDAYEGWVRDFLAQCDDARKSPG